MADSKEYWKRDEEEEEEEVDDTVSLTQFFFTIGISNLSPELYRAKRCSPIRHRCQQIYACIPSTIR